MASGIIFDSRLIGELVDDKYVLKLLELGGVETVRDLQRKMINDEYIYLIGPRRRDYLRGLLNAEGLISSRPWTDRFYNALYGHDMDYAVLTERGEKLLVDKLVEWLFNKNKIPHSNASANPVFIFFGRMGIGRIQPIRPGQFGTYETIEVVKNEFGRYDDVVQRSGQLARICDIDIGEVNRIYQNCVRLLRSHEIKQEVMRIFLDYGEMRK